MSIINRSIALAFMLCVTCSIAQAETVFTYQGKLGSAGQPANGAHDFRFRLYNLTSDLTVLSQRLTRVDNDVLPARLRCTAQNRVPQNAETLSATVWCLSVP